MPTGYPYLPLTGSEIRLLCISLNDHNIPAYRLVHASLDTSSLVFSALSYTWEGQEPDQELRCTDGTVLLTTRNVLSALSQLNLHNKQYSIWIDGICINQSDASEKEHQIPLMSRIYSAAGVVIVWLGESSPRIDAALEAIPALILTLHEIRGRFVSEREALLKTGLPDPESEIWIGLGELFSFTWWSRTWVLQEVALAREVVVLCGKTVSQWGHLRELATMLRKTSVFTQITNGQSTNSIGYGHGLLALDLVEQVRHRRAQNRNGAAWFLSLLMSVASKSCTDPRDRLYGVIGLTSNHIQQSLQIRYDLTPAQVYLGHAKWHVESGTAPIVLLLACSKVPITGLPSWCPNFNAESRTLLLGILATTTKYHAGFESGSKDETRYISCIAGCDSIKAQGYLVDKISRKVSSCWKDDPCADLYTQAHAPQALAWEASCLALSQHVYNQPSAVPEGHWRTLIANKLVSTACVTDQRHEYSLLLRYLRHVAGYETPRDGLRAWERLGFSIAETANMQTFGQSVCQATQARSFVATEQGRIGLVPAEAQEGDWICVVRSLSTPLVLRPRVYDNSVCELVGESYIHGLMAGEALQLYGGERLQEFVID